MPTPDPLLNPALSTWSVYADLDAAVLPEPTAGPDDATRPVAVVPLASGDDGESAVRRALVALGLDVDALLAAYQPSSTAGATAVVPQAPGAGTLDRLVLVGVGEGDLDGWRAGGAAAGRATRERRAAVHLLGDLGDHSRSADALAAWVEGAVLGGWTTPRWTREGAVAGTTPVATTQVVTTLAGADITVARAVARAGAQCLARALVATPSNVKNPAWMARQARTLARRTGLTIRVWDEKDLRKEGFGGLLAVGGGSATPPRLVRLDHEPPGATRGTPRVVLVGKGITFDTGGLQVKPVDGMLTMKTDMSGSAVVLAVLAACRELEVPVRVTGLLALAENAVGGGSYRPGDVITQYGGTTVEIGNTDAEGRIVLADALAYADAHLDPAVLLDIATLTGAARIALARVLAPVYATDGDLGQALVAAGATTGETLWPMPLPEAYRRALDSDVADLTHIAPAVGGGSITAALFLREFVGERRWAHLDIAGTGRSDVDAGLHAKGGTAFGARLLLRWLEDMR